jgi:hypothetical protein
MTNRKQRGRLHALFIKRFTESYTPLHDEPEFLRMAWEDELEHAVKEELQLAMQGMKTERGYIEISALDSDSFWDHEWRRFKRISAKRGHPVTRWNGIQQTKCTICQGSGNLNKAVCPRCSGAGEMIC